MSNLISFAVAGVGLGLIISNTIQTLVIRYIPQVTLDNAPIVGAVLVFLAVWVGGK